MTSTLEVPVGDALPRVDEMDLSIVIPVKDEEESIPVLSREIECAMRETPLMWECLWIDDGSRDRSLQILKDLSASDPRHRVIDLDRNYGQSASLIVGFRAARGRIVATLDGDLQNDPKDIPRLLAFLRDADVHMVNGVRVNRQDTFVRKLSSRIGNGFRNWVTGDSVTDVGCSMRVFYRECVDHLPVFNGMHRFLPTLVRIRSYRITETPVNHRQRTFGKTKYGIGNRLWVGLGDTLFVLWYRKRRVEPRVRAQIGTGEE